MVRAVNEHDSALLPESFEHLMKTVDELSLNLTNTAITLDAGFDSYENKTMIEWNNLIPIIKPNLRGTKDLSRINERLDAFERMKHLYKERYKIERVFAWKHTYRKLVIRYEKLQSTFLGFRYLAYAMINFRSVFERM